MSLECGHGWVGVVHVESAHERPLREPQRQIGCAADPDSDDDGRARARSDARNVRQNGFLDRLHSAPGLDEEQSGRVLAPAALRHVDDLDLATRDDLPVDHGHAAPDVSDVLVGEWMDCARPQRNRVGCHAHGVGERIGKVGEPRARRTGTHKEDRRPGVLTDRQTVLARDALVLEQGFQMEPREFRRLASERGAQRVNYVSRKDDRCRPNRTLEDSDPLRPHRHPTTSSGFCRIRLPRVHGGRPRGLRRGLKRRVAFDTVSARTQGGHMKSILIIADGLGGRPTDRDGKTCLEAARRPHLDRLAGRGAVGLVDPIGPGIRPGSDTAHLSLLGYNPREFYTGRGVFECVGIGLDVQPGDICFRANFATVEGSGKTLRLVDRRAGRIESGQQELEEALDGMKLKIPGVEVQFRASTEHRGALLLRGRDLSPYVGETDPHEPGAEIRAAEPLADGKAARRTADAVNELTRTSHELLNDLPLNRAREAAGKPKANILLVRGAADCPHIPSISSIYGIRGAVIAGGALYRGVALACGFESIDVAGATGGLNTNLRAKAEAALEALSTYDLVFVHIKGTDNAAHDHDAAAKIAFIERIDAEFFGPLDAQLDWTSTHLAFTGDHTTAVDYGDHTADPVPALFVGPNVLRDDVTTFDERAAARGGLLRWSGQILPMLLSFANQSPKYGS